MANPKNEAFIDIEESLTRSLVRAWNKSVSKTIKGIERALDNKDYELAHKLADVLNFDSVDKGRKLIDTMGAAALFLGASRHSGDVKKSGLASDFPQQILDSAVEQYITLMKTNATEAVRMQAHITIAKIEQRDLEEAGQVVKAETFNLTAQVSQMGGDMFNLSSNMTVSRLNSFGFMAEATIRGVTTYQVSEILDSRTCPVCQVMHGQTFDVPSALAHAQTLLTTTDPNTLKMLAPWPKHDAASVSKLGRMSTDELNTAGLNIPPYHPRCRGITVVAGTHQDTSVSILGDNAFFFSGLKRPTNITNLLFGDQAVLEAEAAKILGVNAAGAGAAVSSDFLLGVIIGITVEELVNQGYTQEEAEALYRDSGGI